MANNTPLDLKRFFGVSTAEMSEFWKSLSEAEKEEFRSADLS